jgi:hypothetical protein
MSIHYSIKIEQNVPIAMRDGTILRCDVYRPDLPGRFPAIVVRTPYNKRSFHRILFHPVEMARAGYAFVIQDLRGRFESEGVWERHRMFEVEPQDGYDTVEGIAAMPWCDGNVALAGPSYMGSMQWITAMANPPHLRAFAPYVTDINTNISPPPECGVINFSGIHAMPRTAFNLLDKLEEQGEDVSEMRSYLEKMVRDPDWAIRYLPFKQFPLNRYEPIRKMIEQRLNPPSFEEMRRRRRYERITVPGLHVGGWFDQFDWAVFAHFNGLREKGGSDLARSGQHVLIGPWDHYNPTGHLGSLEFGTSSNDEMLLRGYVLDFYDKYVRGRDVDVPAVRYFVMGINEWKTGEAWPLPQTEWQRWYLRSGGQANTAGGDGVLSREEPPAEEPADRFVYDPLDPVPTVGGRVLPLAGMVPGPLDQSILERRQDILCYTSEPLVMDLEVSGPLILHLFASTDAVDTDFAAKLIDVYPDGRSILLADGIQRARFRNWDGKPTPVEPGEIYEFKINLGNTSNVFRKGHRIRIHVSSSNFPLYDRNMNTGNPIGEDATGVPAHQTIFHQAGYASHIDLPVIPER